MKKVLLPIAVVLLFAAVGYMLFSGGANEATDTPDLTPTEAAQVIPSDEQAELTGFAFMGDFVLSAPPEADMAAAMQAYDALSESAKAEVSVETLSRDLALFVGVQDVPDQGLSVEDLQVDGESASLVVGMNYSGGRVLKSVNMVAQGGEWKVDSVTPYEKP